ncbi:NlpC/P60 family protein [Yinghuangia sp. ASG 101]|uniref:C40 family peptidase n=1 Tax=Yinghuangia sp. ASG 101 TaxID=2896848 RepID=UPI001E35B81B|nr:C40 family peptidase [Yinghuangia sp. ASG 101]UGQ14553.1 NlpC/P60 family protein [Yinghuangia sp. ASG 101]
MASHRRPAQHRRSKPRMAPRGAATLAVTAAATMTGVIAFAGPAGADPAPTKAQVQEQVNQLHHEVSKATDVYNGVQEKVEQLQQEANATQTRVAEEQAAMNQLREQIGILAANQYRNGGMPPELALALSGDPAEYLQKAQMLDQLDAQQAVKLEQISSQARMLQQDREEASRQLAELDQLRKDLTANKNAIQEKLNKAQQLLNTLTEAERQAILEANEHAEAEQRAADERAARDQAREESDTSTVPASERAKVALNFAMAQIGKPYGWGKAGPSSFDCSGLMQAAWAQAGVKLPRTTWDQVNAGTTVPKSQLQPGDLVFFYPDVSHVGMYIGNGKIVHAPRPGTNIRTESMSVMPYYSAVRPG